MFSLLFKVEIPELMIRVHGEDKNVLDEVGRNEFERSEQWSTGARSMVDTASFGCSEDFKTEESDDDKATSEDGTDVTSTDTDNKDAREAY